MAKGVIYTALGTNQPYLYYTNATGGTVDNNFNNLATTGQLLDGTNVQEAWEVSTLVLDGQGRPDLCNIIAGKHYVRTSSQDSTGSHTKNTVFAAPDGVDGVASFRALLSSDLPAITSVTTLDVTGVTNQLVLGTTNTTTISSTAPSASRVYTIPDAGAAANFLLSAGAQTMTGIQTINKAGIAATATDALILDNSTAATSGVAVQQSPSIHFKSHVWNTTSVAATNLFEGRVTLVPTSGATPSALFLWETNNNSGGWQTKMTLDNSGVLATTELALSKTTAQVTLGASAHKTIITSPAPAGASQTITIPDMGAASTLVARTAAQVDNTGTAAITVPTGREADFIVTYNAGNGAYTLAAPTAGTDDGKTIRVLSASAHAHVVTCSTDGFNAKGSSGTLTLGGAIGDGALLYAYNGHWYVASKINATAA